MARFPDDYPIEILRGTYRPGHSKRRRVIDNRMQWLSDKLATFVQLADPPPAAAYMLNELATLAIVIEMIEGRFPHGAPQALTLRDLDVISASIRTRMEHAGVVDDGQYQRTLAKITDLQTHIKNQIAHERAEQE